MKYIRRTDSVGETYHVSDDNRFFIYERKDHYFLVDAMTKVSSVFDGLTEAKRYVRALTSEGA